MASFTTANTECYVTLQKEKSEEIAKAASASKRPHAQLLVGLCLGCLLAIVVLGVVAVVVFTGVLGNDVADKDSGWGSWTTCSRTCGKAKGRQTRTCTNPGRNQCQGESQRECEAFSCNCPASDGWLEFENRCYKFFTTTEDWSSARTTCQASNAELTSIHSAKEQNFVYNMVKAQSGSYVWIGGNDKRVLRQYEWSDGTTWDYDNWYSGQPNDSAERFVAMHLPDRGEWYDRPDTSAYSFVCKI